MLREDNRYRVTFCLLHLCWGMRSGRAPVRRASGLLRRDLPPCSGLWSAALSSVFLLCDPSGRNRLTPPSASHFCFLKMTFRRSVFPSLQTKYMFIEENSTNQRSKKKMTSFHSLHFHLVYPEHILGHWIFLPLVIILNGSKNLIWWAYIHYLINPIIGHLSSNFLGKYSHKTLQQFFLFN